MPRSGPMKRIVVAIVVFGSLAACGSPAAVPKYTISTDPVPQATETPVDDYTPPPPDPNEGKVTFKITTTGGGRANFVTYSPNGSSMSQVTQARLPWTKTMDYGSSGIVVLNAQNSGGGTITCEIDADGEQVDKQTAEGLYAMVQCSGDVGRSGTTF